MVDKDHRVTQWGEKERKGVAKRGEQVTEETKQATAAEQKEEKKMGGRVAQSCWLLLTLSLKGKILCESTSNIPDGTHI